MKNITLDLEDFTCLIRGGVLTINENLKIALSDIGFMAMANALENAMLGKDIYKNHDKKETK